MSLLPTPTTNSFFTAPRTHIPLKPVTSITESPITPTKAPYYLTSPPRPSRRPNAPVSQLTSSPATPSRSARSPTPRPLLSLRIPHAAGDPLTYPALPPCNAPHCPIIPLHAQGPYQHKGESNPQPNELFGSSNPPPEVWEAWVRFLKQPDTEELDDGEDEGIVLAFLECHGDEGWMYEGGCGFYDDMGLEMVEEGEEEEEEEEGGVRLSEGLNGGNREEEGGVRLTGGFNGEIHEEEEEEEEFF